MPTKPTKSIETLESAYRDVAIMAANLYTEVGKVAAKRPESGISELTLLRTNVAITSVKELLRDESDPFIDQIGLFVPAGDLPEYRDAGLVLSELTAALERMRVRHGWFRLR